MLFHIYLFVYFVDANLQLFDLNAVAEHHIVLQNENENALSYTTLFDTFNQNIVDITADYSDYCLEMMQTLKDEHIFYDFTFNKQQAMEIILEKKSASQLKQSRQSELNNKINSQSNSPRMFTHTLIHTFHELMDSIYPNNKEKMEAIDVSYVASQLILLDDTEIALQKIGKSFCLQSFRIYLTYVVGDDFVSLKINADKYEDTHLFLTTVFYNIQKQIVDETSPERLANLLHLQEQITVFNEILTELNDFASITTEIAVSTNTYSNEYFETYINHQLYIFDRLRNKIGNVFPTTSSLHKKRKEVNYKRKELEGDGNRIRMSVYFICFVVGLKKISGLLF
jgi:hypothetical protein